MSHSTWFIGFFPSLVTMVLICKMRCELLLRTNRATQGQSGEPLALPSTLYRSHPTPTANSISIPPPSLEPLAPLLASRNRISRYIKLYIELYTYKYIINIILSQKEPIGPVRITSVPSTGDTCLCQALQSGACSLYSFHPSG